MRASSGNTGHKRRQLRLWGCRRPRTWGRSCNHDVSKLANDYIQPWRRLVQRNFVNLFLPQQARVAEINGGTVGGLVFQTGFCVLMEHHVLPIHLMQQTVKFDNLISYSKAKTTGYLAPQAFPHIKSNRYYCGNYHDYCDLGRPFMFSVSIATYHGLPEVFLEGKKN